MKKENKKILFFLVVAVVIEVFVCNYQFWVTHLFYPTEHAYNLTDIQYGNGFIVNGKEIVVNTTENCTLTLDGIDNTVKSLVLDITKKGKEENQENGSSIFCYLAIKDEGNMAWYYSIPSDGASHQILSTEKNSKWVRLHPYGKLQGVQITLDQRRIQAGDTFQINDIIINGKHSMNFSWIRLSIIILGMLFLGQFRGSSKWYNTPFTALSKQKRNCLVGVVVVVQILIFGDLAQITHQYAQLSDFKEYHWLTESLAEGHTYLKQIPSQYLRQMENPYDTSMRMQHYSEIKEGYLYDVAYYEGKYYVYFGVIPVLLLYLPYYLLTGKMLSDTMVVFLASAISVIFLARLLKVVVERYFSKISVLTYILLLWASMTCFGFINLFRSALTYEVAIAMGLMFVIAGLDLWVESVQGEQLLSKTKLFFGSLCVALVAGCRPSLIVIAFMSLLIFRKFLIKDKKLCLLNYKKPLVIFFLPFVIVAVGLMYYNYIRFGSPFDFGMSYNLTTNDVTNRGFSAGRLPIGIFEYLFSPLAINGIFPYIHNKDVISAYMGKTIVEPMAGGVFWLSPYLFFGFLPWIRKKLRKEHFEWAVFSMSLFVMGVVIATVDASAGGILSRYQADFAIFFILAADFAVLMQEDVWLDKKVGLGNTSSEVVIVWHNVLLIGTLVTVIIGYLFFFLPYRGDMNINAPEFYNKVRYLIEFWR